MYYDYSKIVSYNSMLNFIIGERGVGKTYGITKLVVNKFLKKGEEFAYIRRYRTELAEGVPKFFDAINKNNEFPEHSLRSNGKKFYIDNKVAGYSMTLATSQDLKSTNFSKVTTIIFDEFLIEPRTEKILS